MEGSREQGLIRDAAGDRNVDLAARGATTDLQVQAATRVEPTAARLDVGGFDHPRGLVLTLGGELDLAAAPGLQERLDDAIRGRAAVIIDLSRLKFIDSSGLQMLVRAEQQLRESGGHLMLVRGPRAVHHVFELTGLDSYFDFCDSPSAAELDRGFGGVTRS